MHVVDSSGSGKTTKTFNFFGAEPGEEIAYNFVDNCGDGIEEGKTQFVEANINGTALEESERNTSSVSWSAADTLTTDSTTGAVQFWDGAETTLKACCEWSETRIDNLDKLKDGLNVKSAKDSEKTPKTPKTPKGP